MPIAIRNPNRGRTDRAPSNSNSPTNSRRAVLTVADAVWAAPRYNDDILHLHRDSTVPAILAYHSGRSDLRPSLSTVRRAPAHVSSRVSSYASTPPSLTPRSAVAGPRHAIDASAASAGTNIACATQCSAVTTPLPPVAATAAGSAGLLLRSYGLSLPRKSPTDV